MVEEKMTLKTRPTEPWAVLTGAFIAKWFGLDEDMARYVPDERVRQSWPMASHRPQYVLPPAQLGKVVFDSPQSPGQPAHPRVEPAELGADGSTEFLLLIQEYEGRTYLTGKVAFSKDAVGRWVVLRIDVTKEGGLY